MVLEKRTDKVFELVQQLMLQISKLGDGKKLVSLNLNKSRSSQPSMAKSESIKAGMDPYGMKKAVARFKNRYPFLM